ncbi:hypothetical protein JTE90_026026 [Oedothorax gibbosus]|uniref:Uncharacterized protein n=1 Tax=Oedothorax gibbosus TaxID=931172 RepID=A0AAV6TSL1_9ARAC|nr:hypothetical protein JTE90_026026 [Oedothorax gibbosus]
MVLLQQVAFPRYVLLPKALVEIHAFCDASEKAYCAVLYARSISSDSIRTVLPTSKTRVAPLKVQSLPRLELCSALLLSNLLSSTLPHLDIPISAVFAWSDSQITLAWISSEPSRWKPFVANRVSQIQELVPEARWNFVRGLENPAACGTRGLTPSELVTCDLWFNGPRWLSTNSTLPLNKVEENQQLKEMSSEEKKPNKIVLLQSVDKTFKIETFHKFSSWSKMKGVLAWCLRFTKNCALTVDKRNKMALTTVELNEAEKTIVKFVQQDYFSTEISFLSAGKQLPSNNRLIPLSPFYDDSGLLPPPLHAGHRARGAAVLQPQVQGPSGGGVRVLPVLNGPRSGHREEHILPEAVRLLQHMGRQGMVRRSCSFPYVQPIRIFLCERSKDGYVTDVAWSNTNAPFLFVTKTTGCLELWDVLVKNQDPILSFKLESDGLVCVHPKQQCEQIACGTGNGCIHLLEVPKYTSFSNKHEKNLLSSMIDREGKREKLLEGMTREQRARERINKEKNNVSASMESTVMYSVDEVEENENGNIKEFDSNLNSELNDEEVDDTVEEVPFFDLLFVDTLKSILKNEV